MVFLIALSHITANKASEIAEKQKEFQQLQTSLSVAGVPSWLLLRQRYHVRSQLKKDLYGIFPAPYSDFFSLACLLQA